MKPLSQSLEELAARVKVLEDFGDRHVRGGPRQARDSAATRSTKRSRPTSASSSPQSVRPPHAGRTWWNDTKASMKRPLDEVRARIDKRQSEHELHRALRARGRGRGRRRRRHRGRGLLPERRRVRRHRRRARPHGRRRPRRRAGPDRRSDVMMRPYVGSWKRLAVHGVAAVLFGLATLVWPDITLWALVRAVGCVRVRRRHHRAVGRDHRPAARPPRLGRLLGRHRHRSPAWSPSCGRPSPRSALLVVIATWSLLIGGSQIAFAISARKQMPGAWSVAPRRRPARAARRAPRRRPR